MKPSLKIFSAIFISSFVSLSLSASVAYAWVYKTQQLALQKTQAETEKRIAAEEALREALQVVSRSAPAALVSRNGISKDDAWGAWYQAPEHCGMNVSESDFVACVNHKMLARKEFERTWRK